MCRMTYDDYVTYFTMMAICQVLNTSMFSVGKTWIESVLHGSWSTPDRSGGCVNNKATFLNNPQVSSFTGAVKLCFYCCSYSVTLIFVKRIV